MSTPVPHLSRTNSTTRGASSTPQPNGVAPTPAPAEVITPEEPFIKPQSYTTNYAIRLKSTCQTGLIVPAVQASTSTLPPRSARRGQTAVNYAEDDDDDFDGRESRRGGAASATSIVPQDVTAPMKVPGKFPAPRLPWRRTPEQLEKMGDLPEVLIPVAWERAIENDTKKIRERFMWNIYEPDVTPERFARQLCFDLDLDPRIFVDEIVTAIRTACQEWAPIATHPLPDKFVDPISGAEGYYLVPIKLNVQCGTDTLTDSFLYNLYETEITPEDFASQICRDIGYHGESRNAITVSIREELLKAKKDMFFPTGSSAPQYNWKNDGHIRVAGVRYDPENMGRDWCPNIEQLTREEVERKEIDRERETRRLRRETTKLNPVNMAQAHLLGSGIDIPGTPGGGSLAQTDTFSRRKRQPMIRGDRDDSPMRKGSVGGQGGASTPMALASTPIPLGDTMLLTWKCSHCGINGLNTWGVRDGPFGKYTLCAVCGLIYYDERKLPEWRKGQFERDLDMDGQVEQ